MYRPFTCTESLNKVNDKTLTLLPQIQLTCPGGSEKDDRRNSGAIHQPRFLWDFGIHTSIVFPPVILVLVITVDQVSLKHPQVAKHQTNGRNFENE